LSANVQNMLAHSKHTGGVKLDCWYTVAFMI
jgi:hypothetical protein